METANVSKKGNIVMGTNTVAMAPTNSHVMEVRQDTLTVASNNIKLTKVGSHPNGEVSLYYRRI